MTLGLRFYMLLKQTKDIMCACISESKHFFWPRYEVVTQAVRASLPRTVWTLIHNHR